ncbi:uncharacterized protein LOC120344278 [Styela clava]
MEQYFNTRLLGCICILLHFILSTVKAENIHHEHCLQWCMTKYNVKCSEIVECEAHYNEIILKEIGEPRPIANYLKVTPYCYEHDNSNYSHIGLKISWEINGQYMRDELVTEFHLEIQEFGGHSTVSNFNVRITPNMSIPFNNYIHFEYFYLGWDSDNVPEISENVNYTVELDSLPLLVEKKNSEMNITPQTITREFKIPANFRKMNNCTAPDESIELEKEETTTISTTTTEQNAEMLTIVVTVSVIFVILLIVVIVGIVSFLFRKEKAVQNNHRAQNILVLLNMGDRTEIGKQTNWMATALSRAKNLGPLTVKYNKWESKLVAENGIAEWMRESVAWADKVIISSTPDELRVEENALAFERAFEHTMMTSIIVDDEAYKPVFVVHFEDEIYHNKCPFLKDERYKKFHLEEDWQDLCRDITDTATGEKEPLQNGSRQNSYTINKTTGQLEEKV